jgi:hypothetical protein
MPWLRQLPRWAWFGTGVLAFIAGLVNAVLTGACGLGYGVYRQYFSLQPLRT